MFYIKFVVNIIILFGVSNCYSNALGTVYDQRQTGEYNIHLNIKDITIIAIDSISGGNGLNQLQHGNDDAVYEDYDYNLDELTINPFVGLFGKPSTKPPSIETSTTTTTNNNSKPNVNNIQEIIALQNTTKFDSTIEPVKKITTPSNLVIIQESSTVPIPLEKQNDTVPQRHKIKQNYNIQQHIPVQVVMEPISIPKRRNNNKQTNLKRFPSRPAVEVVTADSVKQIQSGGNLVQCTDGKFRDANGRCRRVRKAEGLTNLVRLLLSNQKGESKD